jgi:hypothetical protein
VQRGRKISIGIAAAGAVAVAVAMTQSFVADHFRITLRTEGGTTRYRVNNLDLDTDRLRLLSIVRKIGGLSRGPFQIRVDQRTPFVEVARLVEAIKKEAPRNQYFLTYVDTTNQVKVFYDARVFPDPHVEWFLVEGVGEETNRVISKPAVP